MNWQCPKCGELVDNGAWHKCPPSAWWVLILILGAIGVGLFVGIGLSQ